jgi:hypothetical protein
MGGRQSTKKQAVAKKDRMAVLNSHAVEINRFLAGKRQFLDDAGKLAPNLTGRERQRLFSAGVKNYGFIEKAYDVARGNPDFAPPHLNIENLAEGLREFDTMRQLVFELEQYLQAASDVLLVESDAHYRTALRIYDSLQEQTRSRVHGAEPLFEALRTFFKRRKRKGGNAADAPTEKQIEKDVKQLVKGKADGEIIIKNESPKVKGGKRTVVDNVNEK